MKPRKGAIAVCSRGILGLITSEQPEEVEYPDGNKGVAWTGIQLDHNPGAPWSSREPKVLYYEEKLQSLLVKVNMLIRDFKYID